MMPNEADEIDNSRYETSCYDVSTSTSSTQRQRRISTNHTNSTATDAQSPVPNSKPESLVTVMNMKITDNEYSKSRVEEGSCQEKGEQTSFISVAKVNRLPEKIIFLVAVLSVLFLVHAVISVQWLLPYYFTVALPTLVGLRIYQYTTLKWQYFLFDFCYFVNLALIIFIWACPWSKEFFSVLFCWAQGPLLAATVVFRNSLVFHDYDRLTSMFIHILPSFMTFSIRWYPDTISTHWYTPFTNETHTSAETSMVWLLGVPLSGYILHKVLYIGIIHLIIKPSPEYLTSFSYLSNKGSGFIYTMINLGGERYHLLFYVLWDVIFTAMNMTLTRLFYEYFYANMVALLLVCVLLIWNGSTFYMDKFSNKGFKADTEDT